MKYLILSKINKNLNKLTDSEIVNLGPWCNDDLEEDNKTQRYHWRNAEDMRKAAEYIYFLHKKILPILSQKLNEIHQVNYGYNFWTLLIGPWLYDFMSIYYDRYLSINSYLESNNNKNTMTSIYDDKIVPQTYQEFSYYHEYSNDEYNHYLYGNIIKHLDTKLSIEFIKGSNNIKIFKKSFKKNKKNTYYSITNKIKKLIIKIKIAFEFYFLSRNQFNDTVLANHDLRDVDTFYKISKNKDMQYLWNIPFKKLIHKLNLIQKTNDSLRSNNLNLNIFDSNDKYCNILSKAIIENLPIEYLENFKNNIRVLSPYIKSNYKFIISKWIFVTQTHMRYYFALQKKNGSKIIACQKGGNFGIRDSYNSTNVEIDMSDYYLSWGWKYKNQVIDFYFTKTHWYKKDNYNKNDPIILTGASCRKFFFSFLHSPSIIYNHKQLNINSNFLNKINIKVQNKLIYRFYNNYGFNEHIKIKKKFPNIKQSHREDTPHFYHLMFKSSLFICSNDVTAHKQAFIINKPTILLFKMEFFTVKEEFKIFYQILKEAEIFYEDPILCARHINKIYTNPMDWWMLPKVQNAKNLYLDAICKFSDTLEHDLANEINKIRKIESN